jgi:hypothetical protein
VLFLWLLIAGDKSPAYHLSFPDTRLKGRFMLSHPSDKNKDVARMGQPRVVGERAKSKSKNNRRSFDSPPPN